MKTIQFKVTLLSDVILSQNSGTKGNKKTLDFIPGANFLGIVAKKYDSFGDDRNTVFHSSKVRFGDAHPLLENVRALRQPAALQKPKNNKENEDVYVHHMINDFEKVKDLQLKQARGYFYAFVGEEAKEYKATVNFAIKSAYDRNKRRSQDEQMYGYQSIGDGSEYCFELNIDNDVDNSVIEKIKNGLIGKHTVGRSRTAQYGLIEVREDSFNQTKSNFKTNSDIVIYVESRLIFTDKFGNLSFIPQPEDFGVDGGEIDWNKSQIRTFAYTPWNFTRSAFDPDRKGIEKGSVIIISGGTLATQDDFVGLYQNEGFGKVIFNPDFLIADADGKSKLKFPKPEKENEYNNNTDNINKAPDYSNSPDKTLKYLAKAQKREADERKVYLEVNAFVKKYSPIFKGERFASQWGTIRSLAMQYPKKEDLEKELFTKKTTRNGREVDNAYLTHGVAKDKWDDHKRKEKLIEFFESIDKHMIQFAMINLAAEMAKKSEGK